MELFSVRPAENSQSSLQILHDKPVKPFSSDDSSCLSIPETQVKKDVSTFKELGLCDWIINVTRSVGYKSPTEIQKHVIPAILSKSDILAGAETGSGKTASYILPLLHLLSQDPYGIFAIILAPTRELAIQISDQILILGASMNVTIALVIGGNNFISQSLALDKRPHFLIATPGRLRQHIENSLASSSSTLFSVSSSNSTSSISSVNIFRKISYLILDEADKLISNGFVEDLDIILNNINPKKNLGFFSATLTASLKEISTIALKANHLTVDLTEEKRIPSTLIQQYIVTPSKIKICYLIALLFQLFQRKSLLSNRSDNCEVRDDNEDRFREFDNENEESFSENPFLQSNEGLKTLLKKRSAQSSSMKKGKKSKKRDFLIPSSFELDDEKKKQQTSIIIFVDTCQRAYELNEILQKFSFSCVSLHSLMTQQKRITSLQLFKSLQANILIATDVASRGLDIPEVNYVINFNLPKICSDYIHRVGKCISEFLCIFPSFSFVHCRVPVFFCFVLFCLIFCFRLSLSFFL
jgi:ATP-dependent RNA helicase DDX49/DBP8